MKDNMTEIGFSQFSFRELFYLIFKHKKKILFFFITVSCISFIYVKTIPDVYRSEASLLITAGRENVEMIPTANNAVTVSRTQDLDTEIEILRNRDVIKGVVDSIGIETFLNYITYSKDIIHDHDVIQDIIITSLMENIYLAIKRNTNIIEISYETVDPQLAQKVISTLISVYIDKRNDIHYSNSEYQFFKEQVMEVQIALNNVENKLSELKNKLTVGSFEDYYTNIMNRINVLQQDRDQNQTAMIQSESKIGFFTKTLKDMPTSLQTGTVIGNETIQSQIYSLYSKRQELSSKYSEDNNQLKEIDRQIAEMKKLLTNETKIGENQNPNYLQLQQDLRAEQTNLVSLRAGSDAMNKKMDDLKKEVNNYNAIELELSQLEREKNTLIDRYNKYSSNLEEAQIDQIVQNQKLSNVKILQPATYPVRPIATRKMRNFALGIFIGFFGGLGLAMVSEYFDHSVKRQEDIEKFLNLRTLVSIPEQPQKKFISFKKVANQ